MKGERTNSTVEEDEPKHANMFTLHRHHYQQLSQECHTTTPDADESGSRSRSSKKSKVMEGGDGASIEVVRRPRGRPPGSKNKPKPPVVITRDTECAMRPHVLEVPPGVDIVEAVIRFASNRNVGLCILSGTGTVANVSLRQPSTTPGATVTFHGRFDILSVSATYLPPPPSPSSSSSSPPPSASVSSNGFAISLAGPQGQIFGGLVIGNLIAASTVFIVATTFSSPSYHRLPDEEDQGGHNSVASDGEDGQAPAPAPASAESCGMSIYSCHVPSDVIWVPTARQPPPPF